MKKLTNRYQELWHEKSYVFSIIIGILFLVASLGVNTTALRFAERDVGSATTDILLDNLPVINTDIVFSEGAMIFIFFLFFLLLLEPETAPFILKAIALFICIRSGFVIMTHIAPYPDHILTDLIDIRYITSGADLFFSGHTGLPFYLALFYWKRKELRLFFIFCSITGAVAVILGHLHYTIDVFSAYFISYGISDIAQKIFANDFKNFTQLTKEPTISA